MRPVQIPFIAPVKGTSFRPDAVARVVTGARAHVRHDHTNPYDDHACGVHVDGELIGYLPRPLAERLCASGATGWVGEITEVIHGSNGTGIRVKVTGTEDEPIETSATPAVAEEPVTAPVPVTTRTGRYLGTLVGDIGDDVEIRTASGTKVRYPRRLVRTDTVAS